MSFSAKRGHANDFALQDERISDKRGMADLRTVRCLPLTSETQGPVTILLDSQETRSGSKSASGSTTPALAGQDPDTSAKEKARADFAAEKQRKKEAYQRQQAENKQRKEDAAQRWASRSEGQDRPADV